MKCSKPITKYYIILWLNINVIMGGSGIFALNLKCYTTDQIVYAIQKRLHEIDCFRLSYLGTVDIREWKVRRVDLAKDIYVDKPEVYALLTNLGVPYGCRRLKRANINKPSDTLYYESCCFSNKSRRINIYNKMAAMVNRGQIAYKVIPDLEHLFRIEYQILKRGVKYNSKKWNDNRSIRSYLDNETVINYLISELKLTFGTERYVTYSLAVQLINQSKETDAEKRKMIRTIELIHQMDGLYNLEKALANPTSALTKELGNLETFKKKRLTKIRNLGINPVVIPDEYGYKELPGLHELIEN